NTNILSTTWLTGDDTYHTMPRMAPFQAGLLVGWASRATGENLNYALQTLDAAGATTAAPVSISVPFGSDWISYPNGDVGWVYPNCGTPVLVRRRSCR